MSGESIREPRAVEKLLNRLIKERRQLAIWCPAKNISHASLLVGLKPSQGIYVDAPPKSVNDAYRQGDRLVVRSMLDGTELRFQSVFQLHSQYEQHPALLCAWPEEIDHHERRRAFRVRAKGGDTAVELVGDDDLRLPARLLDLSLGGLGALISQTAHLLPDEVLDCVLELRGQRLQTKVSVQSFQAVDGTAFWRVGARFLELNPEQERLLGRLVIELQQQAIQALRGY